MFLSLTINGLAMGLVYSLLAIGMILIVRAVKIVNMAQGDLFSAGAYITYFLTVYLGLSTLPMLIIAIILFGIIGVIFLITCIWPMRNSSTMMGPLVSTIGASIAIREGCTLLGGTEVKMAAPIIKGSFQIGGSVLQYQYLIIMVIAIVLMVCVYILFNKLYFGRIMEAAAQDKYAASLIGIPMLVTTLAIFIIVMIITGLDGWLVSPTFVVSTALSSFMMRAFAGVVIGGFGNLKGAIVGSLIIGFIESYSTYITTTYKDVIVFSLLIIVLLVRPQGLFGENIYEKA